MTDRWDEEAKKVWHNVHAAYWDHIPDSVDSVIATALRAAHEATLEEAAKFHDGRADVSQRVMDNDQDGVLSDATYLRLLSDIELHKSAARYFRSLLSPSPVEGVRK